MRRLLLSNLLTALVVGAVVWLASGPRGRSDLRPGAKVEIVRPTGERITDAAGEHPSEKIERVRLSVTRSPGQPHPDDKNGGGETPWQIVVGGVTYFAVPCE